MIPEQRRILDLLAHAPKFGVSYLVIRQDAQAQALANDGVVWSVNHQTKWIEQIVQPLEINGLIVYSFRSNTYCITEKGRHAIQPTIDPAALAALLRDPSG